MRRTAVGSKKRQARKAQREAFEQSLGDELGSLFAREDECRRQAGEQREQ